MKRGVALFIALTVFVAACSGGTTETADLEEPAAPTTTAAAPTTAVPATATTPTTTTAPVWLAPPEVMCSDLVTHRTCVVNGMPVAPGAVEQWGEIVDYSPEAFCAVDLDPLVCQEIARTLAVGTMEWGNYGPVEYWVVGIDEGAVSDLTEVNCRRRTARGHREYDRCVSDNETGGFMEYYRVGAEYEAAGQAGGMMGRNGHRPWSLHFFVSSPPWGFTDRFETSGSGEQVTVLHEYFHAVQYSFLTTERIPMGPLWFVEGGADWMALAAFDRTKASGVLPDVNVEGRGQFTFEGEMRQRMEMGRATRERCPNVSMGEVGYGSDCSDVAFGFGPWAHAWLAHRYGADALLDDLYPVLEELGWKGAFAQAYGMTPDEFYAELDGFLELDLEEQLAILPGSGEPG